MDLKKRFFKYQAQTTPFSAAFEVESAKGSYIYGKDGKAYLDFVAGVSVNTLGHSHHKVNNAIKKQIDQYMHVMVYGEYALKEPVKLCENLALNLPNSLNTTYLVNSGAEAIDGALKLAKRVTGRQNIVSMKAAYHGNTHGAMSVSDNKEQKHSVRPLLPNINFIEFNNEHDLCNITTETAAVITETIQGAAGFILPKNDYLKKLKQRCQEVGALLIFDEIQPGFGRTGKLFGFQNFNVVPDILVVGKGMANGLPIGAFVSSNEYMKQLSENPILGHITTFGGNPVIAAAANATLDELINSNFMTEVSEKETLFRELLIHPKIKSIKGTGLMLALELESKEFCLDVAKECMNNGLIVFWLLYRGDCLRITPPLTISKEEIKKGCDIILSALNSV